MNLNNPSFKKLREKNLIKFKETVHRKCDLFKVTLEVNIEFTEGFDGHWPLIVVINLL